MFLRKLTPQFIQDWVSIWKKEGIRALIKQKGWKVVTFIFCYYLIRDTFLYIILPMYLYQSCSN